MKPVPAWVAEDGSLFLDEEACRRYEARFRFCAIYGSGELPEVGYPNEISAADITYWLDLNRRAVLDFYGVTETQMGPQE